MKPDTTVFDLRKFQHTGQSFLEALIKHWPSEEIPFFVWGIHHKKTYVPIQSKRIHIDSFRQMPVSTLKIDGTSDAPLFFGVISYDDARAWALTAAHAQKPSSSHRASLIYQATKSLVIDHDLQTVSIVEASGRQACEPTFRFDSAKVARILQSPMLKPQSSKGLTIFSDISDDTYLEQVRQIKQLILEGRFYQLNYLRYFRVKERLSWSELAFRCLALGGQYACLFRHGPLTIGSLSPERFIEINPTDSDTDPSKASDQWTIRTQPIKGTTPRYLSDPKKDDASRLMLLNSKKDQAELHMIVDLLRNDLATINPLVRPEVSSSGIITSNKHVHHLEADIVTTVEGSTKVGAVIRALCPGGSITGAPKIEVMSYIDRLESRSRGYFMGHAFMAFANGRFDSNLLIRTTVSTDHGKNWEYAAGSGIVIKSSPEQELEEVNHKCKPITAPH